MTEKVSRRTRIVGGLRFANPPYGLEAATAELTAREGKDAGPGQAEA